MKYILMTILIINWAGAQAGQNIAVSTTQPQTGTGIGNPPFAGQTSYLWAPLSSVACVLGGATTIDAILNGVDTIDVYLQFESITCPDPVPPFYVVLTEIPALNEGNYQLNYYELPAGIPLPPPAADAGNYLIESINFEVLGVMSVNSTDTIGLALLMALMLLGTAFMFKRANIRDLINR